MDGAFHLTPLDVRRYDFGSALRGYDKTRVDQFREQVADELERLTRANQELESKARNFAEQLKSFRERDKAINDALVSAQQLRSEMREQADRESQLTLREARAEGDRLVDAARSEIRKLEDEIAALTRTRRAFASHLRSILERQLAELDSSDGALPPGEFEPFGDPSALRPHEPTRALSPTPAWLTAVPAPPATPAE